MQLQRHYRALWVSRIQTVRCSAHTLMAAVQTSGTGVWNGSSSIEINVWSYFTQGGRKSKLIGVFYNNNNKCPYCTSLKQTKWKDRKKQVDLQSQGEVQVGGKNLLRSHRILSSFNQVVCYFNNMLRYFTSSYWNC